MPAALAVATNMDPNLMVRAGLRLMLYALDSHLTPDEAKRLTAEGWTDFLRYKDDYWEIDKIRKLSDLCERDDWKPVRKETT